MIERAPGKGWLALLGGGEFSFGETEAADLAWLRKAFPAVEPQLDDSSEEGDVSEEGGEPVGDDPLAADSAASAADDDSDEGGPAVGFVPAASGSTDYGDHFAVYLDEYFDVDAQIVPIFRTRDARRGKNLERLASFEAVYLGGGVTDHLLEALADSPALDTLRARLLRGGVVAAIAASAQALGRVARSVFGGTVDGLGLLPHAAIEANFSGNAPELRRLRQMMQHPEVTVGLGIAAGSVVLLGPDGAVEVVGEAWRLDDPEGDPVPLGD